MRRKLVGMLCLGALWAASTPALAGGPHGHYRHHGHGGGGGGWRASFFVGGGYPAYRPYWQPVYYPAPAYYYPAPVYPVYPLPAPVAVAPVAPVVAPSFSFSFGGR